MPGAHVVVSGFRWDDVSGFRVGAEVSFHWGDGKREEAVRSLGEPFAAAIYDGPEPDPGPYRVRVTRIEDGNGNPLSTTSNDEPRQERLNRAARRAQASRGRRR